LAAVCARRSSIVASPYLSLLTCGWFNSTTSSSHFLSRPSAIFGRTFSGLSAACSSKIFSSAAFASSGTSSSDTYSGAAAAMCSATSRAKSLKSSFFATKSVSQSTSTSTPILPFAWM
jgi:hypothetical protein